MSAVGPVSRLVGGRRAGLAGGIAVLRVVGLPALLWVVASEHASDGSRTVPPQWLVVIAVAWIGWLISGRAGSDKLTLVCLAVLSGAGGVVAGFAPVGIAFPAIAVLASSMAFDTTAALAVAGIGAAALTGSVLAVGTPRAVIIEGLLAIVAVALGGASRRQYRNRAAQAEALLTERMRADAERDRAAALAERNRIGREIHDVLAHSLGALSVQLEAADALLDSGQNTDAVSPLLRQARRLAVEGLSETRAAVHALRDEPVALTEQLTALAAADGAQFTLVGNERPLPADAGLAIYRAAQEALSNARKHAPGADVALQLHFDATEAVLVATNGPSPEHTLDPHLRRTGSGFGLRGMRERIELLGGEVRAEPDERGWTVRVVVPV
jgi:signal transduction histidine kinase